MKRRLFIHLIIFLFTVTFGLLLLFGLVVFNFSKSVFSETGLSYSQVKDIYTKAREKETSLKNSKVTILFLGLDKRDDELEKTLLTDTIMVSSLDFARRTLTVVPVPRDIWIAPLKTKINSIFYYGEEDDTTSGVDLLKKELTLITSITPDYYLILDYQKLGSLIDAVGGIEVDIAQAFTDNEFPNPQYNKDEPNSSPYITVSFSQGVQKLNGEKVLQFVRSRQSADSEGSDIARSNRQTLVIQSLLAKIKNPQFLTDAKRIGKLYKFWQENIETDIDTSTLIAIGLALGGQEPVLKSASIPSEFTASTDSAILVNPPVGKYGQWVFEPRTGDWEEVKEFFSGVFELE